MMFEHMLKHACTQELHFCFDEQTGLKAVIAIHSKKLGPALGGCRFVEYPSTDHAITDALRLAEGMSYKAAMAGLSQGGGKSVIIKHDGIRDRQALFARFGEFVNSLNGQYITAVDSGTSPADMDVVAEQTPHVTSTTSGGDPSPFTALGVMYGISAAVQHRLGSKQLQGVHVAIQGLGNVGMELARLLHERGATLTVADLSDEKVTLAKERFGCQSLGCDEIYQAQSDVFAPCGLGAVINDNTINQLKCSIVAGAANNQLADSYHGQMLQKNGILYAPDYVINAGGLIYVSLQHQSQSIQSIEQATCNIGKTLTEIFENAADEPCINGFSDRVAQEKIRTAQQS